MNETVAKKAPSKTSQKHIDGMVNWVVQIVEDLGPCTIKNVAASAGKSYAWATGYLRRAHKRGLIFKSKTRPVIYKPLGEPVPDTTMFEQTGVKTSLTLYFDTSCEKKIEALSAFHFGNPYGGQGKIVSTLIDKEIDRLQAEGTDLTGIVGELKRHDDTMKRLRGRENDNARVDKSS